MDAWIVDSNLSILLPEGILAIVLLSVLGLYQFKKGTGDIDSIAVLPLVNVGKGTEMEYLTDGIAETIHPQPLPVAQLDSDGAIHCVSVQTTGGG